MSFKRQKPLSSELKNATAFYLPAIAKALHRKLFDAAFIAAKTPAEQSAFVLELYGAVCQVRSRLDTNGLP